MHAKLKKNEVSKLNRNERSYKFGLQDIPYKTTRKYGKPIRRNETPNHLKRSKNNVESGPQCEFFKLKDDLDQCLIVHSILEDEGQKNKQPIVNTLSSKILQRDDDSSQDEHIHNFNILIMSKINF